MLPPTGVATLEFDVRLLGTGDCDMFEAGCRSSELDVRLFSGIEDCDIFGTGRRFVGIRWIFRRA